LCGFKVSSWFEAQRSAVGCAALQAQSLPFLHRVVQLACVHHVFRILEFPKYLYELFLNCGINTHLGLLLSNMIGSLRRLVKLL
jgi:hypothetical protein